MTIRVADYGYGKFGIENGSSHPNLKSVSQVFLRSLAEALYGGEDFVCGFDPFIGPWVVVVGFDEGGNVGLQLGGGAVDAASQLLTGQFCEPSFDLIDPTG